MRTSVVAQFTGIAAQRCAEVYLRRMRGAGWKLANSAYDVGLAHLTLEKDVEISRPDGGTSFDLLPPTERWLVEQVMVLLERHENDKARMFSSIVAENSEREVRELLLTRGKRTLAGLAMADMDVAVALEEWDDDDDALLVERRRRIAETAGMPDIEDPDYDPATAKAFARDSSREAEAFTGCGTPSAEHHAWTGKAPGSLAEVNAMLRASLGRKAVRDEARRYEDAPDRTQNP